MTWIRTQTQLENENHPYSIFHFHQNGNGKLIRTIFNLYQPQKRPSPSTLTSISFLSYRALIPLTYSIRKRRKIWLKKLLLFLQFPLRLNSAGNHWTDISTFFLYILWMYDTNEDRKGFSVTEKGDFFIMFYETNKQQTKNSTQMYEKYFGEL